MTDNAETVQKCTISRIKREILRRVFQRACRHSWSPSRACLVSSWAGRGSFCRGRQRRQHGREPKVAEFGGSIVRALSHRVLLTSCSSEKGSAAQRAFAEPAPAVARCCSTSAGRFFALVGAKSGHHAASNRDRRASNSTFINGPSLSRIIQKRWETFAFA
jgi:hypothetical protein